MCKWTIYYHQVTIPYRLMTTTASISRVQNPLTRYSKRTGGRGIQDHVGVRTLSDANGSKEGAHRSFEVCSHVLEIGHPTITDSCDALMEGMRFQKTEFVQYCWSEWWRAYKVTNGHFLNKPSLVLFVFRKKPQTGRKPPLLDSLLKNLLDFTDKIHWQELGYQLPGFLYKRSDFRHKEQNMF